MRAELAAWWPWSSYTASVPVTDNAAASGLTNAQVHALQNVRDALPGALCTTKALRDQLESAWEGSPGRSALAADVHDGLEMVAAAIADVERLVAPFVDQAPVEDLGLPVRAVTALRDREGIRTIAQLGAWPEPDLKDIPGIGPVLLREIKVRLRKRGIVLPPSPF